jgi:ABC-type uncharacterized transport system substrate-binding protein
MPKKAIGILHSGTQGKHDKEINAFISSLKKAGYYKPKNLTIIGPLWADDDPTTLNDNAKFLAKASTGLNLMIAAGGTASVYAAQDATKDNRLSVVFTTFSQLTSPASNMTGVDARTSELDKYRLTTLYNQVHTQWPNQTTFGVLENQTRNDYDPAKLADEAARLGLQLDRKSVYKTPGADPATVITLIKDAFKSWQQKGIKVALVAADPIFNNHRADVIKAEQDNNIAAMHQWHEFKDEGGYASYGTKLIEAYQMAGTIAGQVLGGTAPGSIPVQPLTNIGLSVNRRTAKRLGL